jgi:hypothetical protein
MKMCKKIPVLLFVFIVSFQNCIGLEYKELKSHVPYKEQISIRKMDEDCEYLKYIVENGYINYDEMKENGIEFEKIIENVKSETEKTKSCDNKIDTFTFERNLVDSLQRKINKTDQHFRITGKYYYSTGGYEILYSGVFLTKKNNEYFVCTTPDDEIKIGMKYTGLESNLRRQITSKGEDVYRYCVFTDKTISKACIYLDGKSFPVEVKSDTFTQEKENMSYSETKDSLLVTFNSFDFPFSDKNEQKLSTVCDKIVQNLDKKNIVFDLRNNRGGYSTYPMFLLISIFYAVNNEDCYVNFAKTFNNYCYYRYLTSPVTIQWQDLKGLYIMNTFGKKNFSSDMQKKNESIVKNMKRHPQKRIIENSQSIEFPVRQTFNGKLIILMNRNTASCAELVILLSRVIDSENVILVGENSEGCISFMNMKYYWLPNSGIIINCCDCDGRTPILFADKKFLGEGKGFQPDYFCTSEETQQTLRSLTGDSEINEE